MTKPNDAFCSTPAGITDRLHLGAHNWLLNDRRGALLLVQHGAEGGYRLVGERATFSDTVNKQWMFD